MNIVLILYFLVAIVFFGFCIGYSWKTVSIEKSVSRILIAFCALVGVSMLFGIFWPITLSVAWGVVEARKDSKKLHKEA